VLAPGPDGVLDPDGLLTRGEILDLLAGLAEAAGVPEWRGGELAGVADGQLTLLHGENAETFSLDPEARLFRRLGAVASGARELTLRVGDHVGFVAEGDRIVFLEVHQTRQRAALDDASRHYHWEKHLTPADVARKVARYGRVGEVRDIVPRRLGVSGRVVELEVQGSEGALLLEGLKVRWGLGLRENLFVIDRETGDDGGIEGFVISGKGWGHGVGLCQVGAFGMAQGGSSFEEILGHYYTGIRLALSPEFADPASS
jgi:stage II sporulation protein D